MRQLENMDQLKALTLAYLRSRGAAGDGPGAINRHVLIRLVGIPKLAFAMLHHKEVRDRLSAARRSLKAARQVSYDGDQEPGIWRAVGYGGQGKLGAGWRPIEEPLVAVRWLHRMLSPDAFESFCATVLSEHCSIPMRVTAKRRSGADGGFDGIGVYEIDGQSVQVGLQVKRYAPDRQVGEDDFDRFAGGLIKRSWSHGIMMTTGTFSVRAQQSVSAFEEKDVLIELVDQNRLAEIMLYQSAQFPDGFGMHRAADGTLYMNEAVLLRAAGV